MGYFQVRDKIYDRRALIRLTTDLVLTGGDSCLRGRELESQHRKLDR